MLTATWPSTLLSPGLTSLDWPCTTRRHRPHKHPLSPQGIAPTPDRTLNGHFSVGPPWCNPCPHGLAGHPADIHKPRADTPRTPVQPFTAGARAWHRRSTVRQPRVDGRTGHPPDTHRTRPGFQRTPPGHHRRATGSRRTPTGQTPDVIEVATGALRTATPGHKD